MPGPRPGGVRFVCRQFLYLMPDDLRTLAANLRAASPNLHLVVTGLGPKISMPENRETITYIEDLDCPDHRFRFTGWLEPANWKPDWRPGNAGGIYLANEPELNFTLAPCEAYPHTWRNMAGPAPPGHAANEYLFLDEGRLNGFYYPWEPEKERFLRRVRRIFDKYATNQCCNVDPKTLEPVTVSTKGAMDRIGPHAAAWAMSHPRHFLGRDFLKPIDWAEKYPHGWPAD